MKSNIRQTAAFLNLEASYFWRLINGKRNLSYPEAARISRILKCDPVIWLRGGGTPDQRREACRLQPR